MKKIYLLTILVILSWASSLVANKVMLLAAGGGRHLSPTQVAFWCVLVGWVALLLLLAVRGRLVFLRDIAPRGWCVLVLMGLSGWAGYTVALNYAFSVLPLPNAIIINYLHPVFTVLFQGALFSRVLRSLSRWESEPDRSHRPPPLRLALGFLLCLSGVATIATQDKLSSLLTRQISAGALAALFAAFAWGVYSNLGRFVALRPGRPARAISDLHSFLAMSFGLLTMGGALLKHGELVVPRGFQASIYLLSWGPARCNVWAIILFSGFVVYCGGFTLWLVVLELAAGRGRAHQLPPLTYLTPVISVTLGWILLHEGFGAGFWQGAALIALGNLVIVWPGRAAAPRPMHADARGQEQRPTSPSFAGAQDEHDGDSRS